MGDKKDNFLLNEIIVEKGEIKFKIEILVIKQEFLKRCYVFI